MYLTNLEADILLGKLNVPYDDARKRATAHLCAVGLLQFEMDEDCPTYVRTPLGEQWVRDHARTGSEAQPDASRTAQMDRDLGW